MREPVIMQEAKRNGARPENTQKLSSNPQPNTCALGPCEAQRLLHVYQGSRCRWPRFISLRCGDRRPQPLHFLGSRCVLDDVPTTSDHCSDDRGAYHCPRVTDKNHEVWIGWENKITLISSPIRQERAAGYDTSQRWIYLVLVSAQTNTRNSQVLGKQF